ncbi:MAG: signal peptidase I [Phycisphaerae bacterium]|nr:signal peptidase I [Phycisphaerae bacterium]
MAEARQEDFQRVHERRKKRESLLETLESILVAFVLAFVFRAFIIEAFVIPTGSMAPTLYGAHTEFECQDCGYRFAVGAEGRGPLPVCPNCFLQQTIPPRGVPLFSGDRVLVLKFLYDFEAPRRWDIIVFRNPNEPAQNYIKRLVALPGERVELVRGDVTIDGRVVSKTDRAQDALWMIVHDTRHQPPWNTWTPRWKADAGWRPEGTGWRLEASPPQGETYLTYEHRDPKERPSNILDFYAYNSSGNGPRLGSNVCTDLGLRTDVTLGSPQAVFAAELAAYKDRFRLELSARGAGRPTRILMNGRLVAEAPDGVLVPGRAAEILIANVDHRLMLLVDGKRVLTALGGPASPQGDPQYEPTPLSDDERLRMDGLAGGAGGVRVGASGGPVRIEYLRLDRDVYYTNEWIRATGEPGHATEGHPYTLGEGEFFVLGDNSPNSSDGRLWDLERPVVPRRNLVGKAFFVYWPAAGRRTDLGIPLLPDPTGWRFVH